MASFDDDESPVWLSTGAEPRPRNRLAEARRLFVPGSLVLLGATAVGVVLLVAPGSTATPPVTVAAHSMEITPPASGRGLYSTKPRATPRVSSDSAVLALTDESLSIVVVHRPGSATAATKAAASLRKEGWPVSQVTMSRLPLRSTTVFYPKGHRSQAREVAKALPGTQSMRVAPASLRSDVVTVAVPSRSR